MQAFDLSSGLLELQAGFSEFFLIADFFCCVGAFWRNTGRIIPLAIVIPFVICDVFIDSIVFVNVIDEVIILIFFLIRIPEPVVSVQVGGGGLERREEEYLRPIRDEVSIFVPFISMAKSRVSRSKYCSPLR